MALEILKRMHQRGIHTATGAFLLSLKRKLPVELMNFNPLARDKFRILGRPFEPKGATRPFPEEKMEEFRDILRSLGLSVK